MAGVDANLIRDYEAYKDASKEELEEYLSKLPPSKRQAYLDYAAKMEAKKAAKEEKKKKESQGQLGCLAAVLVFAGIIGITAYFQDNEDKKDAPAPPKVVEQQSKSESKSAAAVVSPESSNSKNDDAKLKELKKMEIARWSESTNNQLKATDEGFKNLWNLILASISEGNKDKAKTRQNIDDFNKMLEGIKESLKNQKFSEHLSKDERDKLKEANEDYIVWIDERKDAADDLKKLIEKSDIPPEKLKEIEETLKKSDEQLFKTKSAIEEFQKGMGF